MQSLCFWITWPEWRATSRDIMWYDAYDNSGQVAGASCSKRWICWHGDVPEHQPNDTRQPHEVHLWCTRPGHTDSGVSTRHGNTDTGVSARPRHTLWVHDQDIHCEFTTKTYTMSSWPRHRDTGVSIWPGHADTELVRDQYIQTHGWVLYRSRPRNTDT